ncbi:MAG: pilus assembly protein [Lachnospiraceae bacterium]|nr:pilus assembly protein [Lachnospiraceae bacterium]
MFLSDYIESGNLPNFHNGKAPFLNRSQKVFASYLVINSMHIENNTALQAQSQKIRTSLRASKSGSVTLEAALIMPVIIFMMYAFLMIGQMLIASEEIDKGINETARYYAKDYYGKEEYKAPLFANLRFREYIDQSKLSIVKNGVSGVIVTPSITEDNIVEIKAVYRFHIPIASLSDYGYTVLSKASARIYDGLDKDKDLISDDYVYVAKTGSVYHTNLNCSYISVHLVEASSANLANKRYCMHCKNHATNGNYVTVCGDCIHKDINCSSLNRTIHLVRKSDINGLPLCSKCQGGG